MAEKGQSTGIDIGKDQIAGVYAKALVGAAEKSGTTDSVLEELDSLVFDVFDRQPRFEGTLGSPRLSPHEKSELLDRILGGKASAGLLTFLKVVGNHGRLDCLRQIRRAARRYCNMLRNRTEVSVATAQPMTDEARGRIYDTLRNSLQTDIDLDERVNENLLGGMVVRVGDTVYDSSLMNRLKQMKGQAVKRVAQEIREHAERFADN